MCKNLIFFFVGSLIMISCGPSPEAMAKKNCDLHTKFQDAELKGDSVEMMKYVNEMVKMDQELQIKHKNNPEWLTSYQLERDACIIKNIKKNE